MRVSEGFSCQKGLLERVQLVGKKQKLTVCVHDGRTEAYSQSVGRVYRCVR